MTTDLKMVRFQDPNKVCARLYRFGSRGVYELIPSGGVGGKQVVRTTETEVVGKGLVAVLYYCFSLTRAFLLEECLLSGVKESILETLVT